MRRPLDARAERIFQEDLRVIVQRTDQMFFWLLLAQWLGAVVVALTWSPRTWIAQYWSVHQHVIAAAVLGGLFAAYPLYLIRRRPGAAYTRHVIAIGQMLQSALLVHVTGGRIETHFHVFGSLALLSFYRDWRVLITASAVVYVDHLALGVWFPLSAYGVTQASLWRSVEHAWWVVFEDVFLMMSCRKGIEELSAIAERQVRLVEMSKTLEDTNRSLETRVAQRTEELRHSKEGLEEQVRLRTAELQLAKDGLEQEVERRTVELRLAKQKLEDHVRELELLNRTMIGREERILDLKNELRALRGPSTPAS
jgi:C4-dicarboxylate-specific signal transduction histidine kinase